MRVVVKVYLIARCTSAVCVLDTRADTVYISIMEGFSPGSPVPPSVKPTPRSYIWHLNKVI